MERKGSGSSSPRDSPPGKLVPGLTLEPDKTSHVLSHPPRNAAEKTVALGARALPVKAASNTSASSAKTIAPKGHSRKSAPRTPSSAPRADRIPDHFKSRRSTPGSLPANAATPCPPKRVKGCNWSKRRATLYNVNIVPVAQFRGTGHERVVADVLAHPRLFELIGVVANRAPAVMLRKHIAGNTLCFQLV